MLGAYLGWLWGRSPGEAPSLFSGLRPAGMEGRDEPHRQWHSSSPFLLSRVKTRVCRMQLGRKTLAHCRAQRREFSCLRSTVLTSLFCLFSFLLLLYFSVFLSFSPFFFFGSDQKYYSEFKRKVLVSQVLVPAIGGFTGDTFVECGEGQESSQSGALPPCSER